ncbi:LOW QUALITY PROTEIN: V(D)J recombination-activating protein 2 [Etheostoma spectabile]|uniref:LOW QUALITY PROTEIN: V(D)J recombination-activating protein 2 n=1 Tax=Etheostoma spectabile TaxID=54343 RepID=UPI0013AFB60B|nr:LOW QUALITY PROTEIN: V(D)J recombination-activating protein 2 [Etheostoma spectabile]
MTLQPLTPVNCAGLIQPGFSLLQLDGEVLLFGQKGWPKRSCPTGVFGVRIKCGEMKLRAISFSNDSCYLPPLRCPAVCRLDPYDGLPESYLIHGGRTPNNEISSSLYLLTMDSRGCNRKLTLCCKEKELVGEVPGARYGHTMSMVQSHGKTACVLFGGRSYMPAGERTTESWNSVVDCPPQVFLFDLEFGCSSAHTLPELSDGQSFHLALAREDCVYFLGGHSLTSDSRLPRLVRLRVELLQGSPLLSCETLETGISISSAIISRTGPSHRYIILGGYQSDSQKRMECSTVILNEKGIHFETLEAPKWIPDIIHSRTWFGGSAGEGSILLAVPTEGRPSQADMHYFYQVSFQTEGDSKEKDVTQGCSQEPTEFDDSTPLEDSEELYFGREPHELEDSSDGEEGNYNEEDEEDESQTSYWIKCCLGCQVDPNTWEPYYSTELHRPAMIFCSRGEGGHWVHAQCMELSETLLLRLSQGSKKYFCHDHGGLPYQEMTPPRQVMSLKRIAMKVKDRKTPPTIKMSPAKKSFFRRLFD